MPAVRRHPRRPQHLFLVVRHLGDGFGAGVLPRVRFWRWWRWFIFFLSRRDLLADGIRQRRMARRIRQLNDLLDLNNFLSFRFSLGQPFHLVRVLLLSRLT